MSIFKNTISRVGEIVGNAFSNNFPQDANKQSQMPASIGTEIAVHGSRPPRNAKQMSRARVKAQPSTNVLVKTQIFNGDYEAEPLEISDDNDEVQEVQRPNKSLSRITEPKAITTDKQPTIALTRHANRRRSRALGQTREEAEAEAEESERFLGPEPRMASRRKNRFVEGGYRPVNTFDVKAPEQGRSRLINNNRLPESRTPIATLRQRASTPKKTNQAYSNEAEGSPPRKRQRTDYEDSTSHKPWSEPVEYDDDELNSNELMNVAERTRIPPVTSSVKETALRRLPQSETQHHQSPLEQINGQNFTQKATTQRRQEEARHSHRIFPSSTKTPSRKIITTPGASKMDQRLSGLHAKAESPDVLHKAPAVVVLSPPEPDPPEYPRFDLRFFFCQGLNADGADCYVLICPKFLEIRYKNEVLSKDALFQLPYSRIRICKIEDDKEDAAAIQLGLSGGFLPSNLCYLVFISPKQCFDFVRTIQEYWSRSKIVKVEHGWIQGALHNAMELGPEISSADRAQLEKQVHANQVRRRDLPHAEADRNDVAKRKLRPLDSNDRPLDQVLASSKTTDSHIPVHTRKMTRGRTGHDHTDNENALAQNSGRNDDLQSLRKTRARSAPKASDDQNEEPRPRPEPRVTGTPWEKPLTYPTIGPKKQTMEWADLKRLEDEELLNDNVVGLFLRYIQENANPEYSKHIHTMSTFFYETLMRPTDGKSSRKQINYSAVSKWTKTVDIFDRDFVIVPINESLHWYTLLICNLRALTRADDADETMNSEDEDAIGEQPQVVDDTPVEPSRDILKSDLMTEVNNDERSDSTYEAPKSAKRGPRRKIPRTQRKYSLTDPIIITLDSLDMGGRSSTASMLKDYIIEEGNQKKSLQIDKQRIKGMTAKGIPHQGNFYDCGLYVCLYLERFMANPRKFVEAVLTRADSTLPWPKRLPSSRIRQRFYDFLQELYRAQEQGCEPRVPEVGKILLRDEDYLESDPKRKPPRGSGNPGDLEKLRTALDFAEDCIDGYSNTANAEQKSTDLTTADIRDGTRHGTEQLIDSIQQYVNLENQTVVIDDDNDVPLAHTPRPVTSRYFDEQNNAELVHETNRFETPRDLANSLRERRESVHGQDSPTKDVIDFPTPIKHQKISNDSEMEREHRGDSVSTDFLFGEKSYDNGSDDTVRADNEPRQMDSRVEPPQHEQYTRMIIDSQPENGEVTPGRSTGHPQDDGHRIANGIIESCRSCLRDERQEDIVSESEYEKEDGDDDIQLIGSRSIHINQHAHSPRTITRGDDQDTEMLLH